MLAACPHCNFLAAHAPGQPRPLACPRCGQALGTVADNARATTGATAAPAATGAAGTPPLATLLSPAVASAAQTTGDAGIPDPARVAASSSAPEPPLAP